VEQLRADGHRTFVFGNSTNTHLAGPRAESWDQVYSLVATSVAEWRARESRTADE
jgi:hypothetical protein